MPLLRLVTRMNIGGPARQALLLTKGLTQFPTVLAAGRPGEAEGELTDPEVAVRPVPLVRPIRPATDLQALGATRRLLRETQAPLIHTHMAKAGFVGRAAGILQTSDRPRLVHTFHGHVLQGYFGAAKQRAFLEAERLLAKRTDALIAVSPEIRDDLLSLAVGAAHQYRVIPLGFDLSRHLQVGTDAVPRGLLRAAVGVPEEVPLVGAIGRLVPIKAHSVLLEALSEVPKAHLAIVGDGEERPNLERLAAQRGLEGRVHFVGWWLDVASALADLDVVALTSRNEGTPVALIEALAACRPVVATDVGGVRYVVQDGETGWLAPPNDPSLVASLLRRVLDAPDEAAALAAEGRRRVASRFGHERMLADHAALYAELVER